MDNILNQYNVQLSTPQDYFFYNNIVTVNETMAGIVQEHYTIYTATNFLKDIDSVINDSSVNEIEFDSLFLSLAVVTKSVTYIYNTANDYYSDRTITPNFSLPTFHFRYIVKAWLDYLNKSSATPKS